MTQINPLRTDDITATHDDVIKWKHSPRYWPFVWGIHRSLVNSPHKGQWRGALMFSLISAWINGWVKNGKTGDLRRNRAHNDVIVMQNSTQNIYISYNHTFHNTASFWYTGHAMIPKWDGCQCPLYKASRINSELWFTMIGFGPDVAMQTPGFVSVLYLWLSQVSANERTHYICNMFSHWSWRGSAINWRVCNTCLRKHPVDHYLDMQRLIYSFIIYFLISINQLIKINQSNQSINSFIHLSSYSNVSPYFYIFVGGLVLQLINRRFRYWTERW